MHDFSNFLTLIEKANYCKNVENLFLSFVLALKTGILKEGRLFQVIKVIGWPSKDKAVVNFSQTCIKKYTLLHSRRVIGAWWGPGPTRFFWKL